MINFKPIAVSKLLEAVSGTIVKGDVQSGSNLMVSQLGEPLEVSQEGVAFFISETFVKDAAQTRAQVVVTQASLAEQVVAKLPDNVKVCISSKDAYLGLAHFSKIIADADQYADWRLNQSTSQLIDASAKVDATAKIGPGVVVGENASIGARTVILANAVIGPEVKIGSDCVVFPGVVVYPKTVIGNRVRLHANVVLGSDGFGYARGPQGSVKIWHLGRVVIGDDVEIGSGTTIDRGTMKDTIIERGAKLDNLVQVGHNGHVKAHAILCAQVGMAGNATVGMGAILAGKAGLADKVEIGDGALIGPMTGISKDIKPGEQIMGQIPGRPRRDWWRFVVLLDRLPDLYDRVKKLEGNQK